VLLLLPYCGGVRWPAPEKSPDLGNSSSAPRALMYVASLRTSVHHHHTDDQDESEEAKAGWLRSGLKEWSDYWTFTRNLENTDLIYGLLLSAI
jgi:hypothetical protein